MTNIHIFVSLACNFLATSVRLVIEILVVEVEVLENVVKNVEGLNKICQKSTASHERFAVLCFIQFFRRASGHQPEGLSARRSDVRCRPGMHPQGQQAHADHMQNCRPCNG